EVLEDRRPMTVAVSDPAADVHEVELLRELGFDSLLMLPMVCGEDLWGLVEVYDNRADGFATGDVDAARRVVERACAVLERLAAIERRADTEYSGLALNERGYERLVASGLDRVDYTLAATETFNQRNGNRSLAEAQDAADSVLQRSELPVTFTISVAFGCPFE